MYGGWLQVLVGKQLKGEAFFLKLYLSVQTLSSYYQQCLQVQLHMVESSQIQDRSNEKKDVGVAGNPTIFAL